MGVPKNGDCGIWGNSVEKFPKKLWNILWNTLGNMRLSTYFVCRYIYKMYRTHNFLDMYLACVVFASK